MVPISTRPVEIEDRVIAGHWEGDLVMGIRPSAIGTLVERTNRYTALVALPDGIKAQPVRPHLTRSILGIPKDLRRSLTWDRGREMAEHRDFTAATATGVPVYFRRPRSPWQRGTNENTNRLLRQYLPRARTSANSAKPTWTRSPKNSTTAHARSLVTDHRSRSTLAS